MPHLWMGLTLSLVGCMGGQWDETRALCGFEDAPLVNAAAAPAFPSEACVDAVLDDFGADVDALLAADGLLDPYGVVYGEPDDGNLQRLLWAAHTLLTAELGEATALHDDAIAPAVREALDQVARRTGHRRVNALLYDFVTGEVATTSVTAGSDVSAALRQRTLLLVDLPRGIDGAAILVHEARHRHGPRHVVCEGIPACDTDHSGSIGFQMAVHALAKRSSPDEIVRKLSDAWLEALDAQILVTQR